MSAVDPEREWKEHFALFDKSGNGYITTEELRIVLEQLGANASPQQVKEFVQSVDDNGDGRIQFTEFLQLMNKRVKSDVPLDTLRAAFRALDEKSTGKVHAGELRYVLTGLGDRLSNDEVDEILKEVGTDADGHIDYEQLLNTFVLQ